MSNSSKHIVPARSPFDALRHDDEQGEYWLARELQPHMDYPQWRPFNVVVEKAKASLALVEGEAAAQSHFVEIDKMVSIGSKATRSIPDYRLTRFGAYLTAMAGDDTKEAVARARVYFAVRTREAEVGHVDAVELGDPLEEIERQTRLTAKAVQIAKAERAARELVEAENVELREENAAMLPAVEVYETMIDARGFIPMAVFAQQCGIIRPNGKPLGQNTAIEALREIGILKNAPGTEAHNTPYQEHAHRVVSRSEKRGQTWFNVPYIVPAHAHYISRRIFEYLYPGYQPLPRTRTTERQAIERRRTIRAI